MRGKICLILWVISKFLDAGRRNHKESVVGIVRFAISKSRTGLGGAAADGCGARFEAPLTIHLAMQRTLATPDTGNFGGLGSSTRTGETSSHGLIRRIAERLLG